MEPKELANSIYNILKKKGITTVPRIYFIKSVLYGKEKKTPEQLADWLHHLEVIYGK
jgi:hypothetical protein